MYAITLERTAEKALKKLSAKEFWRVISKIKSLAHNPRVIGCRKIVGSKNDWRIRIGDYRVIYEIDDAERSIKIMKVRHRKEIYR